MNAETKKTGCGKIALIVGGAVLVWVFIIGGCLAIVAPDVKKKQEAQAQAKTPARPDPSAPPAPPVALPVEEEAPSVEAEELASQEKEKAEKEIASALQEREKAEAEKKEKIEFIFANLDQKGAARRVSIMNLRELAPNDPRFVKIFEELAAIEKKEKEELERKDAIAAQFDRKTGEHQMIRLVLRTSLNDPDSYEHASTTYEERGKLIRVTCLYRAKNAFGAKVLQQVTADCSIETGIIEKVIYEGFPKK
jgi:hypothetical protein